MTERNKIEIAFFAKMLALFVWGVISIATFAGVMNYCPEPFVKWCAGILLVLNLAILGFYASRLVKDKRMAVEALQQKERDELVEQANNYKK